ncbi:MAG: hypothetical protein JXA66_07805 [Oligoflexia bacterium]|nr:hypothetical protein [Oligoflexia bacterium]
MALESVFYFCYLAVGVFLTTPVRLRNIAVSLLETGLIITLLNTGSVYYSFFIIEALFVLWVSGIYGDNDTKIVNTAIVVWVLANSLWVFDLLGLKSPHFIVFAIACIFIKSLIPFITSSRSLASGFIRLSVPLFWLLQRYLRIPYDIGSVLYVLVLVVLVISVLNSVFTRKSVNSYIAISSLVYFSLVFFLLLDHGIKAFYDSFFIILLLSMVLFFNTRKGIDTFSLLCLTAVPPSPLYFIITRYVSLFGLSRTDLLFVFTVMAVSVRAVIYMYHVLPENLPLRITRVRYAVFVAVLIVFYKVMVS